MADDQTPLASLSVTHVFYDPDDKVSLFCAYLALLPQALCVVYATLIWSTREAEIATTFIGQLACEALNFALKRLIKEERPARMHGKGYGMPSSHAQFVAFWSVSLTLFLLVRHNPPKIQQGRMASSVHTPWLVGQRLVVCVLGVGVALLVAWSRIYLKYHTEKQVWAGGITGVATGVAWFFAITVLRQTGWMKWALETPIARALRVRDLVVEEDPCQSGWEKWEEKRAAASKDANSKAK